MQFTSVKRRRQMKRRGKILAGAVGLLAACSLLPIGSANAQQSPDSVSLSLRQDTFFGFYAVVNGVHKITENFGFAYGGWWYQDVRGAGGFTETGNVSVGAKPWTEIDLGVNFTAFDKRLSVTPMIGTVHGSLLSTRSVDVPTNAQIFEGVVPNITANWADGLIEAEVYWSYYMATRSEGAHARFPGRDGVGVGGLGTWDFMHYWVNAGVQVHPVVSVGVHWEHLRVVRDSMPGGGATNFYQWIGPYLEIKGPSATAFRFTAGHNIEGEMFAAHPGVAGNNDFYKMAFTKTF
jgi:hypothetical protein